MRSEKKYLLNEVSGYLEGTPYVFLANYERVTVSDVAELREALAKEGAEFHVVKNTLFRVVARERSLPEVEKALQGPTAIIVGGKNSSGVAKALVGFFKRKEKCPVKAGIVGDRVMSFEEVQELAKLPSMEVLRAQLLGLFSAPAQRMVRVMQAVPEGLLTVLQAKAKKG